MGSNNNLTAATGMADQHIGVYSPAMYRESSAAPKECVGKLLLAAKRRHNISVTLVSHTDVPSKTPQHHQSLWDQTASVSKSPGLSEHQMNQMGFDAVIFHNPRTLRQPGLINCNTLLILHGDLSWELPDLLPHSRVRIKAWHTLQRVFMPQLDHVCAVSHDLMNRTKARFSLPSERCHVMYNGIDAERYHPEAEIDLDAYGLDRPYLLHVSSYADKKNPEGLLRAIATLDDESLPLVICGSGWSRDSVDKLIVELDIDDRIIRLGYVDESDIPGLYANAELFIFPSLHETFGLPVVESLACGTPVVTSNNYCLPEVAGGGGIFVDPHSSTSIGEAIDILITRPEVYYRLASRGPQIAGRFRWDLSAEKLINLLSD